MGYKKIITYTLKKETGASLRAVGATPEAEINGGGWDRKNRLRENQNIFFEEKIRWILNP